MKRNIKIGGASGYWGESDMATPQLLAAGGLDYIVYDYLAEITMSILARAKAKDPSKGYATDFIDSVLRPHLPEIARQGVRIISNAGGVNPAACGEAARALIKQAGLDLTVAVITGDDRMDALHDMQATDMFSGAPLPDRESIASANVYLGAFPIAKALDAGADIIITGRCVDSAVTLGACIHEFGWAEDAWDVLASGSLAGHILECGPQATGGNFTDWEATGDISNIGYPIVEINADGSFVLTKPDATGGVVNVGTVSEQMLYEIGDPQHYILPDVVCDFTDVSIRQDGPNRVHVSPAVGRPAPPDYKTCLTYRDGYRAGTFVTLYGARSTSKADSLGAAVFERANAALRSQNLAAFAETSIEIIGGGSQMGARVESDEVVMKIAAKHEDPRGVGIFLKALSGIGLATPPGLSGFTGGGRARPSPVVRLFSYLTPKTDVSVTIDLGGHSLSHRDMIFDRATHPNPAVPTPPPDVTDATINVPLEALAWARSGDKGDKANIGVIAREADYLPYIWAALSRERVAEVFAHFMDDTTRIERFYLPSTHAVNFLLDSALGGGGAVSLRNDAQAKGFAQILLCTPIAVSNAIADKVLSEGTHHDDAP